MTALPGEREKKPSRLKWIRELISDKMFGDPTWDVAVIRGTDEELRVNGQHTSTVLAAIPAEDFPGGLDVTICRWEIDETAEDRAELFDRMDCPFSVRNNLDRIGVDLVDHPDLDGIPRRFLWKVASGIAYYTKDLSASDGNIRPEYGSRHYGAYYVEQENRRFALWVHQHAETLNAWMLTKPGLVAEMLADWKTNPELATSFWKLVLTESHPDVDHETRELSRDFKRWNSAPKFKQERYRSRARRAWQRFRRDQRKAADAQGIVATIQLGFEPPPAEIAGLQASL